MRRYPELVHFLVTGRAPCDLRTVEGFYVVQRPRSYALAMPKGHPYLDEINSALLHIQVRFLLQMLQIVLSVWKRELEKQLHLLNVFLGISGTTAKCMIKKSGNSVGIEF